MFWPIFLNPLFFVIGFWLCNTLTFFCSIRCHIIWSDKQQLQWIEHLTLVIKKFFFNVFNHSRIVDQVTGTEIASFPIYKVLFCARGHEGSAESDCFSFTESYRSSEDFQIHVFSCHIKEAVSSVMFSVQRVSLEMQKSTKLILLSFFRLVASSIASQRPSSDLQRLRQICETRHCHFPLIATSSPSPFL